MAFRMNDALFEARHLSKRYGAQDVVHDLSFSIARGECLGVIGPNGAGKTTTIRMCLGLTVPDAGEGAGERPQAADARRTHDGPGPAGTPPDVGAAAIAAAARQVDPAHDALHGRGRAPVLAAARDRPWQEDRRGQTARPDRAVPR